jgi:hypothetical protein
VDHFGFDGLRGLDAVDAGQQQARIRAAIAAWVGASVVLRGSEADHDAPAIAAPAVLAFGAVAAVIEKDPAGRTYWALAVSDADIYRPFMPGAPGFAVPSGRLSVLTGGLALLAGGLARLAGGPVPVIRFTV